MLFVYRFKPDALPDSARGGVPEADAFPDLLSLILPIGLRRVIYTNNKLIIALIEIFGYIKAERKITALMRSDGFTVEKYHTAPVNSLEMKNTAFPFEAIVEYKFFAVPKIIIGFDCSFNSRKIPLRRKRNNYFPVKILRNIVSHAGNCKLKFSVKALPVVSDKLRPRIFAERTVIIHIIRPACFQIAHCCASFVVPLKASSSLSSHSCASRIPAADASNVFSVIFSLSVSS